MKTIVIEATPCPSCGKPTPAGALAGLCPACLLAQGVGTDSGEGHKGAGFVPPPIADVAKLFPQLEILGLLGAGGMGAVYKARQPALDRFVALKILPASGAEGANFEERFNREARAMARLSHPNIVAVHEFGKADSLHFFIMEFVDGANLRQLEQAGRLAPREALQIIPQICDALQYAHDEGVVHRDIKPENVLVDRKGRVKIADFGLAKILGQDPDAMRLTAEGQVMGTPHYMAPEQVEKPLSVDHRADIYALGVVFYEMLTGDLPLGKFSPPSRKYQLDVRLDDVVLRALENDPARRYQQASEVKTQVENIVGTPAPSAVAAPEPEQNAIRWLGFSLVSERDGVRKVNRKEAFKAFGVIFGVLTIAFGLVSLIAGQNLFGWLGIGKTSLQVRLLAAGIAAACGVLWVLRSKPRTDAPPRAPQDTVILPPERFSRKAIVGACWIPFALFVLLKFHSEQMVAGHEFHGPAWWQIALAVMTLPLGFTAPLGTTILGWLAVGDIRRSRGRISGLPLALLDGLLFPLLALDVVLFIGLSNVWQVVIEANPRSGGLPPTAWNLLRTVTVLVCLLVDFLIMRRVWRTVRLGGDTSRASSDWWWSRKPGAIAIGLACVAIIAVTSMRSERPSIFKNPPQQVARPGIAGAHDGAWSARVPNGGIMELIAISDAGAAPTDWWHPDGKSVTPWTFEVHGPRDVSSPGTVAKDLVFRFENMPEQNTHPIIECDPPTDSSGGGTVLLNGQPLPNARPVRMAWPESVHHVTIRLGVSLVPWRTVTTTDQISHSTAHTRLAGDPESPFDFLQAVERDGQTQLTFIRGRDDEKWQIGVVAVDTKGVEHGYASAIPMPSESNETWTYTYTFPVPLAQVKEFRAQVRPLHWVEFRNVALRGKKSAKPTLPTANPAVQAGARDENLGALVEKLPGGGSLVLLAVSDPDSAPNGWWHHDGTPVTNMTLEVETPRRAIGRAAPPNTQTKNLIFLMKDLPDHTPYFPIVEFNPSVRHTGSRVVLRDGQPWPEGRHFLVTFPEAARTASMRIGIQLEPWRTIYAWSTDGLQKRRTQNPGDPNWTVASTGEARETNDEVHVTYSFADWKTKDRLWAHRLVVVDAGGAEHESYRATLGVSATFHDVPLKAMEEFRVQVRPVHWVEFRDIALHPRTLLPRTTPAASAELWSPTLGPGEKPNLYNIQAEIGEMMKRGDYEPALQRHIWLHNHALEVESGMTGVRLSFYLGEWVELGRRYPRARQALMEVRDLKTREFDEGRGYSKLFQDVDSINSYLNADAATTALFKRIHKLDPTLARECIHYARASLVKNHEYELCLSYIPDVQADFERHKGNREMELASAAKAPSRDTPFFRKSADARFVAGISQLLEILNGAGQVAEAERIRVQAQTIVDDASLWAAESEKKEEGDGGKKKITIVSKAGPLPDPKMPDASLETWTPTVNPGESVDLSKLLDEAKTMTEAPDYESALQRFIWIHNHARKNGGNPLDGLPYWVELGRRFPKARQALIELRDWKAYEFEKGQGYSELFQEIWIMNRSLGAEDATTRLFIRIHQMDPVLAGQCIYFAREALVKSKEYELWLSYFPDVQAEFMRYVNSREMTQQMAAKTPFTNPASAQKSADSYFINVVSQLMEMLKGGGRVIEAENIRAQAAAIVDAPEFRAPAK